MLLITIVKFEISLRKDYDLPSGLHISLSSSSNILSLFSITEEATRSPAVALYVTFEYVRPNNLDLDGIGEPKFTSNIHSTRQGPCEYSNEKAMATQSIKGFTSSVCIRKSDLESQSEHVVNELTLCQPHGWLCKPSLSVAMIQVGSSPVTKTPDIGLTGEEGDWVGGVVVKGIRVLRARRCSANDDVFSSDSPCLASKVRDMTLINLTPREFRDADCGQSTLFVRTTW